MVRWLLSRLRSLRGSGAHRFDLYAPAERQIFHYWNGVEIVKADPVELLRKMAGISAELAVNWKLALSPSGAAPRAYADMLVQIRDLFGVKPLAEGGLTETETIGLMDAFLEYVEQVKKNSGSTETSWILPVTPPSPAEDPPTPSSSDSGSTESEASSTPPTPPPSESESASPLPIPTWNSLMGSQTAPKKPS